MSTGSTDVDPYAELENRADAAELSDGFRLPVAVNRRLPRRKVPGFPTLRRR
jgi:hypothetical protein